MTDRTLLPAQPRLITVVVPPAFVPALERTIEAEQRRHPAATSAQLLDLLFLRGVVFTHDAIAAGIRLPVPEAPQLILNPGEPA
jgi:hypothetical protein